MYFQRIGDLREDSDRKQVEVAKYLGVTQSTYSSYERGDINIPVEARIKLADLYDVSLDYLSAVPRTPNGGSRGKRPSFRRGAFFWLQSRSWPARFPLLQAHWRL